MLQKARDTASRAGRARRAPELRRAGPFRVVPVASAWASGVHVTPRRSSWVVFSISVHPPIRACQEKLNIYRKVSKATCHTHTLHGRRDLTTRALIHPTQLELLLFHFLTNTGSDPLSPLPSCWAIAPCGQFPSQDLLNFSLSLKFRKLAWICLHVDYCTLGFLLVLSTINCLCI